MNKELIWELIEGIQTRRDIVDVRNVIMDEWEISAQERQQFLLAVSEKTREVR